MENGPINGPINDPINNTGGYFAKKSANQLSSHHALPFLWYEERRFLFRTVPWNVLDKRNKWNKKPHLNALYWGYALKNVGQSCSACSTCSIPLVERNKIILTVNRAGDVYIRPANSSRCLESRLL